MAFTEKDNNWGKMISLLKVRYNDGVIDGTRHLPCSIPTDDTTPMKGGNKNERGKGREENDRREEN